MKSAMSIKYGGLPIEKYQGFFDYIFILSISPKYFALAVLCARAQINGRDLFLIFICNKEGRI